MCRIRLKLRDVELREMKNRTSKYAALFTRQNDVLTSIRTLVSVLKKNFQILLLSFLAACYKNVH